jgi:hypothetical protein
MVVVFFTFNMSVIEYPHIYINKSWMTVLWSYIRGRYEDN